MNCTTLTFNGTDNNNSVNCKDQTSLSKIYGVFLHLSIHARRESSKMSTKILYFHISTKSTIEQHLKALTALVMHYQSF